VISFVNVFFFVLFLSIGCWFLGTWRLSLSISCWCYTI